MAYLGVPGTNGVYVWDGTKFSYVTIGAANGIASLDGTGKVPTAQLPSMVATGVVSPARAIVDSDLGASAPTGSIASTVSDNVALVTNDRVMLVGMATSPKYNGPWVYNSAGAWTRPTDYAVGATAMVGMAIGIGPEGNSYGRTKWDLGSSGTITINTTNTTWYQQTYNYTRRRLPYSSSVKLWWKLDQGAGLLVNELTANGGALALTATGGIIYQIPELCTLGTGGVVSQSVAGGIYLATADTAYQPTSGAEISVSAFIRMRYMPVAGTGIIVGFQQGASNVVTLGITSAMKIFGALRVNGTTYSVTGATTLVTNTRYLVSVSKYASDDRIRVHLNGMEDAGANTTAGGTITWAPSSGTRRWYMINDPNSSGSGSEFDGLIEEVRVSNSFNQVSFEAGEYLRAVGAPGRT